MANALYTPAKKAFLDGDIDLLNDDVRAILVDSADYTVDITNHDFLADVPSGARVGTAVALANKSTTGGVFDADDTVLTSVTGDPSEVVLLYVHTGSDATARLIAYIDTATGLPVTPGGGNITIVWDSGANKIFKL